MCVWGNVINRVYGDGGCHTFFTVERQHTPSPNRLPMQILLPKPRITPAHPPATIQVPRQSPNKCPVIHQQGRFGRSKEHQAAGFTSSQKIANPVKHPKLEHLSPNPKKLPGDRAPERIQKKPQKVSHQRPIRYCSRRLIQLQRSLIIRQTRQKIQTRCSQHQINKIG